MLECVSQASDSDSGTGTMNALIIATVALCGPLSSDVEDHQVQLLQPSANHAALAAFDGPRSALALGSGDALGCELFALEFIVSAD